MTDILWGNVIQVFDGDTFEVHVTAVGGENEYEYSWSERVLIENFDASALSTPVSRNSAQDLANQILGKRAHLVVHARDTDDKLICDVSFARQV